MVSSVVVQIATWNVNSIRIRLPRLMSWLERRQPDVACLQEIKVTDEQFPTAEIEALGWRGQIMASEPERAAFHSLTAWGLTDSIRLIHPDRAGLYTWWDYRAGRVPPRLGPADRLHPHDRAGRVALHHGRDRARRAQGQEAVGPCAGDGDAGMRLRY
jgi:exonuclease III